MRAASRRGLTFLCAGLASLGLGCQTLPVEAQHRYAYPNPSRVAQGALVGGLAGAALGAGLDHRDRGRGAVVGAVGGLLAGALFGGELERREAWLRRRHAHAPEHDLVWCEEHRTWERDPVWCEEHRTWERDHAWEDAGLPDAPWEDEAPPDPPRGVAPPDVLFDAGSAELSPGAGSHLRRVADRVRADEDLELLLRGHADGSGGEPFELSERRARSVRAFLAEEGVPPRRIAWVGLGDTQPVSSPASAEGRQRNRRVEIVLRERLAE